MEVVDGASFICIFPKLGLGLGPAINAQVTNWKFMIWKCVAGAFSTLAECQCNKHFGGDTLHVSPAEEQQHPHCRLGRALGT